MNGLSSADSELFARGPLPDLLSRVKLIGAGRPQSVRRAQLAVLLSWLPLAILSIAQGNFLGPRGEGSFLFDIGVHARLLLALPLLIAGEALVAPRLGSIVRHFIDVGFIVDAQRDRFDTAVSSTRRLAASASVEIGTIALAYVIAAVMIFSMPLQHMPPWILSSGAGRFSWAGWWHMLISLPTLLIVIIGLMVRWCLWVRLVWLISRLDLALIPSHPDRAAGLRFVSYSVRAYAPHAMAFGVIVAGAIANQVLYENASPLVYVHLVAALLILVLALVGGPLLLFAPRQLAEWRRGVFEYGAFAAGVGREFEYKWLHRPDRHRPETPDSDALGCPDFSATTDLYSVVANVYTMRLSLFEPKGMLLIAAATILPFIPVMLLAVPLDTVLAVLSKLLL